MRLAYWEEDGKFNAEDYILFYGQGIENWNSESKTNLNLYDSKSYYYISTSSSDGKEFKIMYSHWVTALFKSIVLMIISFMNWIL
jgi:hypothetical protein